MEPVKASPHSLDPAEYSARFAAAARDRGFHESAFGSIDGTTLFAYTKLAAASAPRIYLSAGIHGDEPAPPLALLQALEHGLLDRRATWYVCPLLNPTGFSARTRENAGGLDLNRDYKQPRSAEIQAHVGWLRQQPRFDLVICVHEDWEAQGFYLYELNPDQRPSLAERMLAAAGAHCAIETAAVIDGRASAAPGIIRPIADPLLRETWPEAIYLREHHANLIYTIESPSALDLDRRVRTLVAAIAAGIDGAFD